MTKLRPVVWVVTELSSAYSIAPVVFGAHALEEWATGFPAWVTKHFGTTTRRFYVASHIVLVSGVIGVSVAARQRPDRRGLQLLLASIGCAFGANAVFHLVTSLRFKERSPGAVTAVALMIPGGAMIVRDLLRRDQLDASDIPSAVALGLLLNGAAVASLRVDMPTLRRSRT